jgi:GH25 family lysozyme M1 (1,4-beta-N-acetylmuramidase)
VSSAIRARLAVAAVVALAVGLVASGGSLSATAASSTAASSAAVPLASGCSTTARTQNGFDIFEGSGAHAISQGDLSGACFVYIKASGGVKVTNDYLATQKAEAAAAGLFTGTYELAAPNTGTGAQQATWYLQHGGGWTADGRTLPPMLDLEVNPAATPTQKALRCYDLSPAALRSWIQQYSATIEDATGRLPLIYANQDFWGSCLSNSSAFVANQLFVASYTSAGAPAMPGGFSRYALWQYAAGGTYPGDQDRFAGTVAALRLLANPAASADYTGPGDVTDGLPDLLSTTTAGVFSGTAATGQGTLTSTITRFGSSFTAGKALIPTPDMNGDGTADLYMRDSTGRLFFYAGIPGGGFATPLTIGTGWSQYRNIIAVGDFDGDGHDDLVTRNTAGQLLLFAGTGTGTLHTPRVIASGYESMTALVGGADFTGDGNPDLLVRTSSGQLWTMPHTPAGFGTHLNGPSGFQTARILFTTGDFSGDGKADLLTVSSNGSLTMYRGAGSGRIGAGTVVAEGWGSSPFVG